MNKKAAEKNIVENQTPNNNLETIMPSMIDNEEMIENEKPQDLSSIIPQYQKIEQGSNEVALESKETTLKADGSVIIGNFSENGSNVITDAQLPEAIDIEERKAELAKNKKNKKKEFNKKKKKSSKSQNLISLTSIIVIIGLVAFYFYYKAVPKDSDFQPLHVYVELGEKLPIRMNQYVKPGIGTNIDEMAYSLDTSSVILDKIGDYEFTITHNNIAKKGIITIQDKTAPELEVRDVIIEQGTTFDASMFVTYCNDYSGCNYSFEELNTQNKYTEPGTHIVYVVAEDAFNNKTVKQANLIILNKGSQKTFTKFEIDSNNYRTISYRYDLIFISSQTSLLLYEGTQTIIYTYSSEDAYNSARNIYNGEINYTCDDNAKTITYVHAVTDLFDTYENVLDKLASDGYEEIK